METINQQILNREIILLGCDGWLVKGVFNKELFEGIIAVEEGRCYILSNNSVINGTRPKNKRGYKKSRILCGEDNYGIEDNLRNMIIYFLEKPKLTEKEVDAKIEALKEVIDPNPYKIVEGSISDDEADEKEYERVRWEVRRYELAKAAMQGVLVSAIRFNSKSFLVKDCIAFADEMIKQLKNEL